MLHDNLLIRTGQVLGSYPLKVCSFRIGYRAQTPAHPSLTVTQNGRLGTYTSCTRFYR